MVDIGGGCCMMLRHNYLFLKRKFVNAPQMLGLVVDPGDKK